MRMARGIFDLEWSDRVAPDVGHVGGVTFDEGGDRLWIDRGRVDGQLRAAMHAQVPCRASW